jgi:hypothetical protein
VNATIPKKTRKRNANRRRERNRRILHERKQRVLDRIENRPEPDCDRPMMTANNIHYELADRVQGLSPGGIGAMLLLARSTGLIDDIDRSLHLFKRKRPTEPFLAGMVACIPEPPVALGEEPCLDSDRR